MYIQGDIFDPFGKLWQHLKVKEAPILIDNWVYVCHRKFSFWLSFIMLLCIASYTTVIEDPIACLGVEKEVSKDYLKYYCWIAGTFIVPECLNKRVGKQVPFPGIGTWRSCGYPTTKMYQTQYIYYPMMFLVQVCTFRASKYTWKLLEGGRLGKLLSELSSPTVEEEKMTKRIQFVTDYMTASPSKFHTSYSVLYLCCELLNLFNVIFQFVFFDFALHNGFLSLGVDVIRYINQTPPGYPSPLDRIFPKMTMCHLRKFGFSGNMQPLEALCVMPINNYTEKILIFMWYWLVFLGVVTLFGLFYRALVLCCPLVRYMVLWIKSCGTQIDRKLLKYFVVHSSYGDWFVLSLMQKNMSPWVFNQLMRELVNKMKEVKSKNC